MSGMPTREERAFWNEAIAVLRSIDKRLAKLTEDSEHEAEMKKHEDEYHAQMQKLQEERDKLL